MRPWPASPMATSLGIWLDGAAGTTPALASSVSGGGPDAMPELPPFIKSLQRARRAVPQGSETLEGNIGALYVEYWECCGTPGWLESPRGVWVSYQLDWYERGGGWRSV